MCACVSRAYKYGTDEVKGFLHLHAVVYILCYHAPRTTQRFTVYLDYFYVSRHVLVVAGTDTPIIESLVMMALKSSLDK